MSLSSLPIDIISILRTGYLVTATGILAVSQFSWFQSWIRYGARGDDDEKKDKKKEKKNLHIFALSLPHSYFIHFYVVSLLSSLFWAHQLYSKGYFFSLLASTMIESDDDVTATSSSMSLSQLFISFFLLFFQSARRLFECFFFSKYSNSRMSIIHWLIGISFYLTINIAIWVEGIDTILSLPSNPPFNPFNSFNPFNPSSSISIPFILSFIIASAIQCDCHHYLSKLPKYTLPANHYAFSHIISPHYTAECIIYLSLAVLAAPEGEYLNKTLLAACFFVFVNLAVSAGNSKSWYEKKFGYESVKERWRMLPGVY